MISWPIVVVTGANSGVGFGICHRLLIQLARKTPSDAQPRFTPEAKNMDVELPPCDGLTLIMACRSTKRAEVARKKLYRLLDAHIEKQRKQSDYDGHAHEFRRNLNIQIHYIDLAVVSTVFRFAEELLQKYPYVSHLICNAGVASFIGIDWGPCMGQLLTQPLAAVTAPVYYTQSQGEISVDGLGWVWQCNVFGHFLLFRTIQPLLLASNSLLGARVIWMSSLEASPKFYEAQDWQLKKTEHSYESSKYQIDLIATHLDCLSLQESQLPESKRTIRHFVAQPGVCSTNISHALVNPFTEFCKLMIFYLARLLGSPHHTIDSYKAAIAAVHLSLVSLPFITLFSASVTTKAQSLSNGSTNEPSDGSTKPQSSPIRFGSETGRWGDERVGLTEVTLWEKNKHEGERLVDQCERLFLSLREAEGRALVVEPASERM